MPSLLSLRQPVAVAVAGAVHEGHSHAFRIGPQPAGYRFLGTSTSPWNERVRGWGKSCGFQLRTNAVLGRHGQAALRARLFAQVALSSRGPWNPDPYPICTSVRSRLSASRHARSADPNKSNLSKTRSTTHARTSVSSRLSALRNTRLAEAEMRPAMSRAASILRSVRKAGFWRNMGGGWGSGVR